MTDRMAALATLSLRDVPERAAALDDFYARYRGRSADRRQMVRAAGRDPGAGDARRACKALTAHPAFSIGNPNRVRALIGAFAMANQTQFNRADGAGYDFLADTVLALDPKNPQVAARLLAALKSWRVLEPGGAHAREAALRKVAAQPSLSRDVSDIVDARARRKLTRAFAAERPFPVPVPAGRCAGFPQFAGSSLSSGLRKSGGFLKIH